MTMASLYAEYTPSLEKVRVTISSDKLTSDHGIQIIKPNIVTITNKSDIVGRVELPFLSLNPMTCSNLKLMDGNAVQMCMTASDTCVKSASLHSVQGMSKKIVEGLELKCSGCLTDIANIKSVTKVSDLPPLSIVDSADGFFCHSHGHDLSNEGHNSGEKPGSWKPPPPTEALSNDLEILVNPLLLQQVHLIKGKANTVYCARCRRLLARAVSIRGQEFTLVSTNRVVVTVEETDIDGDFLRYIDVPLIHSDMSFYSHFVRKLIEDEAFRIILSTATTHEVKDFALLWLFDKKACVLRANLNIDCPSDDVIKADRQTVQRVLFKPCFVDGTTELADAWRHDMSVHHVTLPEDVCQGLLRVLIDSVRNLPSDQTIANGFLCGGVPCEV